ncbi:MAG: hypothetical protein OXF08_11905 [Bacteroidetes bacterium]|nr:hypothetical protein [Bacteroidota bacterium]
MDEESQLQEVQEWTKSQQPPPSKFGFDLALSSDDRVTIIDLAWGRMEYELDLIVQSLYCSTNGLKPI